ncbi:unnamed protein product [Allacma fusca]|uniref:GH16 domain-containing protein n=1 Tax=Allacma fusca TaxID=39272 RepID=A0A8J2KIY2_9HEXA|nr:unnamed protein product [Allacma fusca]
MAKSFLTCLLVAGIATTAFAEKSVSETSRGGESNVGDLIFQEEFDGFNHDLWKYEINMNGGGNGEFQIYDKTGNNSYVRDGILYIRPTLTVYEKFGGNYEQLFNGDISLDGCTDEGGMDGPGCRRHGQYPKILPPVTSARLRTKGTFSFRYGRVEVRAKMPSANWVWPAIWMLPEGWKYGGWPASGEIDIVESRGNRDLNKNGQNIGSELVGSTLHFGPKWPYNGQWAAHGEKNTPSGQGFDRDFHMYGVEWTKTQIKFTVDGEVIKTITPPGGGFFELGRFPSTEKNVWEGADNFLMAPFDQPFHFILNVAVGGMYFPSDSSPAPPWGQENPWADFMASKDQWYNTWKEEDAAMQVDYIRVYAV